MIPFFWTVRLLLVRFPVLLSELYRFLMLLLVNQVRDAKIKVLSSLKQDSDEERSEWKKLSVSLKVRA